MDAGEEKIEDEKSVTHLREVACRIHWRALLTALIIALAALAFPQANAWR